MLSVQVEYWKLQENARHNVVTEAQGWKNLEIAEFSAHETKRHNLATEGLEQEKVNVSWATLAETQRHNIAQEGETQRHNIQQENIGWGNLDLGYAELGETSRHNKATESIGWGQIAENRRHNLATEEVAWKNVETEVYKANTARASQEAQQAYWERMASVSEQNVINNFVSGSMLGYGNLGVSEQNAATNEQNADTNAGRLEHDISYDWANFYENIAKDVSSEAREWYDSIWNHKNKQKRR